MYESMERDGASRRAKGDSGFTLIELLVVIVILAILAAIVVFAVGGITDKGQDSACKTDKQTIQTAEEANFAQKTTYTDMPGLVSNKFLSNTSQLYTISASSATGYTIAPIANNPNNCT